MREGRIVEHGATEDVVRRPGHEYTAQLVAAARRTSWAAETTDEVPA
jgi:ABC-type microcin C transport system duplicated ATPase subunit YejF